MSSIRIQKDINARKTKSLVLLGIIICVCLVLCLVKYLIEDNTAPKLDFTYAVGNIKYSDSDPLEAADFLNGVSASDSKDGDLTKGIYVSDIVYSDNNKKVTVSYGVRDYSGNVTTAQRIYNLNGSEAFIDQKTEGGVSPNETTAPIETSQEKTTEAKTLEEKTTEQESSTEVVTEVPTEATVEIPTEAPTEVVIEQPTEAVVEQPTEAVVVDNSASKPVLILSQNEVTYAVGTTGVDFYSFIAQLYDDVDTYYTLSRALWLENLGNVDFNIPGTYVITYHVKDSEGNFNEPAYLTVYIV